MLKFNQTRIYRRKYDGKPAIDRVMHWSDLNSGVTTVVSINDVLDSVNLNLPHLNPMKWITTHVFNSEIELDYYLKNKEAIRKV